MTQARRSSEAPRPASTIRASVLLPILRELDVRGGLAGDALARHGLLRAWVTDPYALVPLRSYLAFFETAAELLGDPFLGARLGTGFKPADIGPVGILFSTAPTIRRGFEGLARSFSAVQGGTTVGLVSGSAGEVVWTYRTVDRASPSQRQDSEFTLASSCQLVRSCFRQQWSPIEVHFEHGPPANPAPLHRIFGAPVLFNRSSNRLVMAAEPLDRVYRSDDQGLSEILWRHIAELQREQRDDLDLLGQVRLLIGLHLGDRPIAVRAVARELGLSTRTLQRRLALESTSLRELVRQYREEVARRGLEEHRAGCAVMAEALGYADGTVFWRAYKSWTGRSPSGRSRGS